MMDSVLNKSITPSSRTKTLFDSYPPSIQTAIIRGSNIDHANPEPTQPFATCMDLITTAQKAKAPSYYLQSMLRDAGVRGHFQLGQLTRLLHSGPVWLSPNKPEGLTLFAIFPTSKDADASRDKEVILSLKACHNKHLDTDDATFLAKKGYFYPRNVHELEIQLTTFTTLCSILFGPTAIITNGMKSWISHFTDNVESYQSQCKDNSLFGTRLIYCININLQQHLHKIKHPHIALSNIAPNHIQEVFANLQSSAVRCQLTVNLPVELIDECSNFNK